MEDKKKSYAWIKGFCMGLLAALAAFFVLFFIRNWDYITEKTMTPTQLGARLKINDIYKKIEDVYLGEADDADLTDFMCAGLVAGLQDKYSVYYTQEQYEKIMQSANGHYAGIGVGIIQKEDGRIQIDSCYENTPAAKAGIQAGDILVQVNGTSVNGMMTTDVVDLIQKVEKGSSIALVLEREGSSFSVDVTVEEVESVSVTGEMLENQIGYIRISEFTGVTSQQYADAFGRLKEQNMERLIIDLRSNPGGLVSGVCDTLRQILPEGVIVYTEDKYGSRKEQTCDGKTPIEIPMAVLVNGSSASAAEIFAGAVQDYGVGKIVGTVTYGKGIVQDTFPLDSGGAVKLTVSHYFTPKGKNIHGKGITPDVEAELPDDAQEDLQLEKAQEILSAE